MPLEFSCIEALSELDAGQWNPLAGADNPFVSHEFLSALESTGCVGPGTGWQPAHLLAHDGGQAVAALPLYLKTDSWGEFVFDWAWAHAYEQAGLAYYPKLVCAVPFTPVGGPRVLARDPQAARSLLDAALELARQRQVSSLHLLFPDDSSLQALDAGQFLLREDCQFHWHDRGYRDFDDFLDGFTAKQRKNVRRERRRVREAGIELDRMRGDQLEPADWDFFYRCYANTFLQRGRPPYMNADFFRELAGRMGRRMLVIRARRNGRPVAAALCFLGGQALYGRYWGSVETVHSLHFETCYYQGIEACLELGLKRFDPGTQGEHKLARGFDPVITRSAHWIAHPAYREAIARYLRRESEHVRAYQDAAAKALPFRQAQAT